MRKIIENRNHPATKQEVIDTSVIICDFLQGNNIAISDVYRFLQKKELSICGLEQAKNQFINYSLYSEETELVKEFLEENKENK